MTPYRRIFFLLLHLFVTVIDGSITSHGYREEWKGGNFNGVIYHCEESGELVVENINAYNTAFIDIDGCSKVLFVTKSIAHMRNLRYLNITNVKDVEFQEEALTWYAYQNINSMGTLDITVPSLKIFVTNSNISKISSNAFNGIISEMFFDGVVVEEASSFAFVNLFQTEQISFNKCLFKDVKYQMFKNFRVENLLLSEVEANEIPSRMFSNISVGNHFTIRNCTFGVIKPSAFLINDPRFVEVVNTNVNLVDGESFKIAARGDVVFRNNNFKRVNDDAFTSITSLRNAKNFFTFDSNSVSNLTANSLTFSDDNVKINNLRVAEPCDCRSIDRNIQMTEFYSDIQCSFNDNYISVKDFKASQCSLIESNSTMLIVICVVAVLIVLVVTILIVYLKKYYRSRQYGKNNVNNGNLSLIVPDGRTYRETELHVIIEKRDLLTTDL